MAALSACFVVSWSRIASTCTSQVCRRHNPAVTNPKQRKFQDGDRVAYLIDPTQPSGVISSLVVDTGTSLGGERFYVVTLEHQPEPLSVAESALRLITPGDAS